MDRDFLSGQTIASEPFTPPAPPAASDYAAPAGVPVADPALGVPQGQPQPAPQGQPQTPVATPQQPAEQPQATPRGGDGRWMSPAEWERQIRGEDVPQQPVAPQLEQPAQPDPFAPPTQPAQPDEAARALEAQRQAFEQERQTFEQERQRADTEREINAFRQTWETGRTQLRQRVQNMPVDQAISAVERYDRAERDAYLQFQGKHLSQREQAAQTQLQTLEQQRYQSEVQRIIPEYVPRAMAAYGVNDLTPDEVGRLTRRASEAGDPMRVDAAIADEWQNYLVPQRQMQQRIDQLSRSQQVQTLANAGVYAVSGGTGNPSAGSSIPKGGMTAQQAAASWYG